ncbi:MAG: DUF5615 family PIN-like protein [Candidatus Heimdallarchaeota archaeon]
MKFLCDSMLGKLTRWLRLLGNDCIYFRDITDENLLEIARSDDRILITKDQRLTHKAQKMGLKVQQITGTTILEKLEEVIHKWNLHTNIIPDDSRCSKCNGEVRRVEKSYIQGRVPNGTFKHQNVFWECTDCRQVYWVGTHWKKIKLVENKLKVHKSAH